MSTRRRLNLEISGATNELLEGLVTRSGAASCTEVIRRALSVYDVILQAQESGGEILAHREGYHPMRLVLT